MNELELVGVTELVRDLDVAAAKILPTARALTLAAGEHLTQQWRANAAATAGRHGRRYPQSITSEEVLTFGGVTVDVGPDSSKPQGGMGPGFEYGSVNQPPHLDGKRAADVAEQAFVSQLELLAAGLL